MAQGHVPLPRALQGRPLHLKGRVKANIITYCFGLGKRCWKRDCAERKHFRTEHIQYINIHIGIVMYQTY